MKNSNHTNAATKATSATKATPPKLGRTAKKLLNCLEQESNHGQVAVTLTNDQLSTKLDIPERTMRYNLASLVEKGLVTVTDLEFDRTLGKTVRKICLPLSVPKVDPLASSFDFSTDQGFIELINAHINKLASKTAKLDASELVESVGVERLSLLPNEAQNEALGKAWCNLFDKEAVTALQNQLRTHEFHDRLTLGYMRYDLDRTMASSETDFVVECKEQLLEEWIVSHDEGFAPVTFPPEDMNRKRKELLGAAELALKESAYCKWGDCLLPEALTIDYHGEQVYVPACVFIYMQLHQIGPYAQDGLSYPYQLIFEGLRSLHVRNLNQSTLGDVLNQAFIAAGGKEDGVEVSRKAPPLLWSTRVASQIFTWTLGDRELNLPTQFWGSNPDLSTLRVQYGDQVILNRNGANKQCGEAIKDAVDVFLYNLQSLGLKTAQKWLGDTNIAGHFFHPDTAMYDLRDCAKHYSWSNKIPESSLVFNFNPLRSDLQQLAQATEPLPSSLFSLSIDQWTQYVWFDMAYRLFTSPDTLIVSDLSTLQPDLANLAIWLKSPHGLRPGLVKQIFNFAYEDTDVFARIILNNYNRSSRAGHKYVLTAICNELTLTCRYYLTSALFKTDPKRDYPGCPKMKFRAIVDSYRHKVLDALFWQFGGGPLAKKASFESTEKAKQMVLEDAAPVFSNLEELRHDMVFTGPSFLILRQAALSMLCPGFKGEWRAALFNHNPAQYFVALTNRPADQNLWRVICQSFLPEEVSINEL